MGINSNFIIDLPSTTIPHHVTYIQVHYNHPTSFVLPDVMYITVIVSACRCDEQCTMTSSAPATSSGTLGVCRKIDITCVHKRGEVTGMF